MNKKTKYIATAIVVIAGLSLVSIPAVTAMYVGLEANGKARGSAKVVRGDKLDGYISSTSDVLIKVKIRNEGRTIYNKRAHEHLFYDVKTGDTALFYKPLKEGDLSITVTNTGSEIIGVNYELTTGHNTIFLSPVEES